MRLGSRELGLASRPLLLARRLFYGPLTPEEQPIDFEARVEDDHGAASAPPGGVNCARDLGGGDAWCAIALRASCVWGSPAVELRVARSLRPR